MALCEPPYCCRPPITAPPGPKLGTSWTCVRCHSTYEAVEVTSGHGEKVFKECVMRGLVTVWGRTGMPQPMPEQPHEAAASEDSPYPSGDGSGMEINVPPVRRQGPALPAGVKGNPLRR